MTATLPTDQATGTPTFGQWITARLADMNMTDVALADRLGIRSSTVGRWRRDQIQPSVEQLRALKGVLGVSLAELLLRAGHATEDELGLNLVKAAPAPDPTLAMIDSSDLDEDTRTRLRDTLLKGRREERKTFKNLIAMLGEVDVDQRERLLNLALGVK